MPPGRSSEGFCSTAEGFDLAFPGAFVATAWQRSYSDVIPCRATLTGFRVLWAHTYKECMTRAEVSDVHAAWNGRLMRACVRHASRNWRIWRMSKPTPFFVLALVVIVLVVATAAIVLTVRNHHINKQAESILCVSVTGHRKVACPE